MEEPVQIMVTPSYQQEFEATLAKSSMQFKVLIEDVDEVVNEERFYQTSLPSLIDGKINFEKYCRYSEIQDYLQHVADAFSGIVLLENPGTSSENRDITAVRISGGGSGNPLIFIDAGIHAREWISPALALYIIHQLLEHPENRNLIENVDWVIIPLLNPDGYEYSHTEDRFWRKTRSQGKKCCGVDANRNFDFHWMGTGSSKDECSQLYGGPSPFSEPEAVALKRSVEKYSRQIKLYLTIHSAAQCLLYPWGYTQCLPKNAAQLHALAARAEEAIFAVNGRKYQVGSSARVLTPSAGSSRDWVTAVAGVNLSYTLELPGGGEKGFDLPPGSILDVVREAFEGIKVFHQHIEKSFN